MPWKSTEDVLFVVKTNPIFAGKTTIRKEVVVAAK